VTGGIAFTIAGKVAGKARPRPGRRAWYVPTQELQNNIGWQAKVAMREAKLEPLIGAVAIDVEIVTDGFPRSDIDNVLKLVADALNKIVYDDDRQIVDAHIRRRRIPGARDELRVKVWPVA
jgi:Holliday junction resolvase RusA-like endonuclease